MYMYRYIYIFGKLFHEVFSRKTGFRIRHLCCSVESSRRFWLKEKYIHILIFFCFVLEHDRFCDTFVLRAETIHYITLLSYWFVCVYKYVGDMTQLLTCSGHLSQLGDAEFWKNHSRRTLTTSQTNLNSNYTACAE